MTDGQMQRGVEFEPQEDADHGSGAMAAQILSGMAGRSPAAGARMDETMLSALCTAARSSDTEAARGAISAMLAVGIPSSVISERYIGAAARRLGDAWCVDEVSFADVTIATARLQGMLRELDAEDRKRSAGDGAPLALVVVPAEEYHTLGAMVVLGQLRRRGLSVRLSAGLAPSQLLDLVESQPYDLILISWASGDTLDSLRRLIISIRSCMEHAAPIVVGGACLGSCADVKERSGADHATSDIDEALTRCGMTATPDGARRRLITA